jgi:CrcB protein
MTRFLWVCLGGAFGTGARYLVSVWALRAFGAGFPVGTLIVNVAGSLLLGVLTGLGAGLLPPTARLVLATGVMGGFTTYSAFNQETLRYLEEGAVGPALLYLVATLVACLAAGALGVALARAASTS